MVILRAGQKVLGISTGRRPPGDKKHGGSDGSNDEVKDTIIAKKNAKKKWGTRGRQEYKDS